MCSLRIWICWSTIIKELSTIFMIIILISSNEAIRYVDNTSIWLSNKTIKNAELNSALENNVYERNLITNKSDLLRIFVTSIHSRARQSSHMPTTAQSPSTTNDFSYTILLKPSSALPINQLTTRRDSRTRTKTTTTFPSSSQHFILPTTNDIINENEEILSLFTEHPIAAILIFIFVLTMIIVTIVGNCMVCLAICMVRKLKQQPANLLLISLAVADFSVGLIVMPIALVNLLEQRWILGELVCRFWTSADLTLCTASILNLCVISVDRYLAVKRTLRYAAVRTRARMLIYVCVVWISALLVSVTPLIFFPTRSTHKNTCQVSQNQVYQICATIISFYAPCIIMVIVYVQMWRAAKRIQKRDRIALNYSSVRASLEGENCGKQKRNSGENETTITDIPRSQRISPHSMPRKIIVNRCDHIVRKRLPFLLCKQAVRSDTDNNFFSKTEKRKRITKIVSEVTSIKQNNNDKNSNNKKIENLRNNDIESHKLLNEVTNAQQKKKRSIKQINDELKDVNINNSKHINTILNKNSKVIHPRKKFRHMFFSPLLEKNSVQNDSNGVISTATVAAAIVHRIQRPSALLSAVRVPLLASRNSHDKGEDKARKTLGIIMSVFIICWLPFFILALVKPQHHNIPKWLDLFVLWLGYSNSMLNPLIYCKYNREFRMPFREMLCCRFRTLQVVMRNESFYFKYGPPRIVTELRNLECNSNGALMSTENNNNNFNFPSLNTYNINKTAIKRNSTPCTIGFMHCTSTK